MSANTTAMNIQIQRLTRGGDYQEWKRRICQHLKGAGYWTIVSGTEFPPPKPEEGSTDRNIIKDWRDYSIRRDAASAQITYYLSSELCKMYEDEGVTENPKTLWDKIANDQKSSIVLNVNHLRAQLYEIKLSECGSVGAYVGKIQSFCEKIAMAGQTISDAERYFHILHGLPEEWENIKDVIMNTIPEPEKWKEMIPKLEAKESELKYKKNVSPDKALYTSNNRRGNGLNSTSKYDSKGLGKRRSSFKGICNLCQKRGHKRINCWLDENNKEKRPVGWKPSKSEIANTASESTTIVDTMWTIRNADPEDHTLAVYDKLEQRLKPKEHEFHDTITDRVVKMWTVNDLVNKASDNEQNALKNLDPNTYWILDSGCSNHLTCNRKDFIQYTMLEQGKRVIETATGQRVNAKGIGDILLCIYNPTKQMNEIIILTNVLHVEECSASLISITQLAENNIDTLFTKNQAVLFKAGIEIACAEICKKLYYLRTALESTTEQVKVARALKYETTKSTLAERNLTQWHQRLGHADINAVQKLIHQSLATGLKDNLKLTGLKHRERCVDCVVGKMPRLPFKPEMNRTTMVLQLIYIDLCGPMQTTSIGGNRYFLIITDAFSRMRHVYFLKTKDQTLVHFKNYLAMASTQTGQKLKAIRSDNGGEFMSQAFREFLLEKGILHQLTAPYTPQEDGVSEVSNKIIITKANTMMHAAQAPKYLWAEAVMTAVQLTNVIPTKGSVLNITPYEAWFGKNPTLDICEFGGVQLIDKLQKKPEKDKKWDARAERCAFVGYTSSTKIWKLFDPIKQQTYITRDVVFYEDLYYWKQKITEKLREDPEKITLPAITYPWINTDSDQEEENFPLVQELIDDETQLNKELELHQPRSATESSTDPHSETIPGAYTPDPNIIPELRSNLGTAWEAPTGKRKSKPVRNRYLDQATLLKESAINYQSAQIDYACMVANGPMTIKSALQTEEAIHWKTAIETEITTLEQKGTWIVVNPIDIPANKIPITSRVILQKKLDVNGNVDRFKARLVAHGFKQRPGIDYESTYAPLIGLPAVRLALSTAAAQDFEIDQIDVVGAFLESNMEEEIYVQLPKGLIFNGKNVVMSDDSGQQVVVRLLKSLYGCKQSALNWYSTLHDFLVAEGCTPSSVEPGVYFDSRGGDSVYLIVWVDDILLSGKRLSVDKMKAKIAARFNVKDLGPISHFLGMRVCRNRKSRTITIDQKAYIQQVFNRFGMNDATPVRTPIEKGTALKKRLDNEAQTSKGIYQEAIGSINYAAIATRPDISYTAGFLGRFAADPSEKHWNAVKRVLRYLKGTVNYGLVLGGQDDFGRLEVYGDADFAGDNDELKSTSGFIAIDRHGAVVAWKSFKQKITAKSTADAEFTATANAIDEGIWLHKLETEFHRQSAPRGPVTVYNDNTACISNLTKNEYSPPNRHIGVRYWWIRDMIKIREAVVEYVSTEDMKADGFTKALERVKHGRFLKVLRLMEIDE